jgi:hypothetical protein
MEDSSGSVAVLSVTGLTTGLLFVCSQTAVCTCNSSRADVTIVLQRLGAHSFVCEKKDTAVSEVGIWIGEVKRQASYRLHTDNISEKYIFPTCRDTSRELRT